MLKRLCVKRFVPIVSVWKSERLVMQSFGRYLSLVDFSSCYACIFDGRLLGTEVLECLVGVGVFDLGDCSSGWPAEASCCISSSDFG